MADCGHPVRGREISKVQTPENPHGLCVLGRFRGLERVLLPIDLENISEVLTWVEVERAGGR